MSRRHEDGEGLLQEAGAARRRKPPLDRSPPPPAAGYLRTLLDNADVLAFGLGMGSIGAVVRGWHAGYPADGFSLVVFGLSFAGVWFGLKAMARR